MAKTISLIVAAPFVAFAAIFAVVFVYFLVNPDTTPLPDRMRRECERQFPTKVNECVLGLMIRHGEEQQRDRMNSAYQRSR